MIHINKNNNVVVYNDKIFVDFGDEMLVYNFKEINQISILTTEERLMNDKVFLVFDMCNETYVMGITHPSFKEALFKQLNQLVELNHELIIDAMQNTGNQNFVLYKK